MTCHTDVLDRILKCVTLNRQQRRHFNSKEVYPVGTFRNILIDNYSIGTNLSTLYKIFSLANNISNNNVIIYLILNISKQSVTGKQLYMQQIKTPEN